MRFNDKIWKKYQFSEIYEITNGINKDKESFGYGFPIVNYMDVNKNTFISRELIQGKVNSLPNERIIYSVTPSDILLTRTSETKEEIAYASCLLEPVDNCVFSGFLLRARPKNNENIPVFIAYLLRSNKYRNELMKLSTMTSRALINSDNLGKLQIKIPNKETQVKISNFLTTIDKRMTTQSKIIKNYESLICSLRNIIFSNNKWKWIRLDKLVESKIIELKRGNIIPKHTKDSKYCYPVYSSSVHNNGLMGYHNTFMFDKELITWSVDGGGDFFYRNKHKFNVTNVCGIMETTNNKYDYLFLSEILKHQHQKLLFDYQTKAHPSVIIKLYYLPEVEISNQKSIAKIFKMYYEKLQKEKDILELYKKQKAYLLQNMFI